MAIVPALANPFGVCILCYMQARGFVVQFNPAVHLKRAKSVSEIALRQQPGPQLSCCSIQCQNGVLRLVTLMRGNMPGSNIITAMELQAIKDAKQNLHDALVAIGSPNILDNQNGQNIEYLIWAIWNGLRASMQRQSASGEIPF